MPVTISCPACQTRGQLPDGVPPNATLTCRACGFRMTYGAAAVSPAPAPAIAPAHPADDSLGVWVGDGAHSAPLPTRPAAPALTPAPPPPQLDWLRAESERFLAQVNRHLGVVTKLQEQVAEFENKARGEAAQKEQALARDRAQLDARARELDAREAELTAQLKERAEGLANELDRQVAAERQKLAERAEAVARGEESLARRLAEVDASEGIARREWQAELDRLRAENAGLLVEADELRRRLADAAEQAASQEETIARMMAAGQRLIRQRDELRAKLLPADQTAAPSH